MRVVRTVKDLRRAIESWRNDGKSSALVPTMGALHEGHLTLIARGQEEADRTVASIFVNPAQFGPSEDLDRYPRQEAEDRAALERAGCDLLYAPGVEEIYPDGFATTVRVAGLPALLCGKSRPSHFDGVSTVVAKLLNQARTDVAVFGEKDWQQLVIIRRVARDLDIPVHIIGAPIVREEDGLAMSSRNRYLSAGERAAATALPRTLIETAADLSKGGDIASALAMASTMLTAAGFAVDYVELRSADDLSPMTRLSAPARLFAAATIGDTRLIDNIPVCS